MKIRGTDFVTIPVTDLKRAARFYRETLGLAQDLLSEKHQWAEFNTGNVTIALKGGNQRSPADGMFLALAVEDVPAACEELRGRGIAIIDGPTDYGCCRAAEIHDPDGNRLVLHHRTDGSWGQWSA